MDGHILHGIHKSCCMGIAHWFLSALRSIPMKDHRHTTAATRKDLPQRVTCHGPRGPECLGIGLGIGRML